MKDIIIYQLEVACCLAVFYLFYRMLLRKEAHFTVLRIYMISALIISFVVPALHISVDLLPNATPLPAQYLQYIPIQFMDSMPIAQPENAFDIWNAVGLIWAVGFMLMCFRIVSSLYQVQTILRKSTKSGQSFKISDSKTASFSFFNSIVLSKNHYHSSAFDYILAHEQAHSDQYHSFDVLLMEVVKAVQWFNPFVWLLAGEALQNLEYLADESVIQKHPNSMEYQKVIVQFAQPDYTNNLRSEFSKSNLKNRIVMMNRPKAPKIHAWKMWLLLPLTGILLMSFSIQIENLDIKKEVKEILPVLNEPSGLFLNEKLPLIENPVQKDTRNSVFNIVDDHPYPSTGDFESYFEIINKNLEYPTKAKDNGIEGKVFVEFVVQKYGTLRDVKAVKGIGYGCDEEAERALKNGPKWVAGKKDGKSVDTRMILPISFGLEKMPEQQSRTIHGKISDEKGDFIVGAVVSIVGTRSGTVTDKQGNFTMIVEDGKNELLVSNVGMASQIVDIRNKEEVMVKLRSADAENDTANNLGVIAVVGYATQSDDAKTGIKVITADGKKPLYIVDGKEISSEEIKNIIPEDIKSIDVLKYDTASAVYGKKAKDGVIIIKTK